MENQIINFYNGGNARPMQVRVLLFNDAINIYDSDTDSFVLSFPFRGATTNEVGGNYFVYPANEHSYLQLDAEHELVKQISTGVENANRNIVTRLLRHRALSLFAIALVLIVALYFGIISLVPFLGSKVIDTDTEIKIGKNLKELMIQQEMAMGGHIDSVGSKNLQRFAERLKLSNEYPIHVTLVNSKTVNAYALPGGEIVVYSGLLKKMESYETLVALLAHESSHVNERHSLRSLLRSAANSIIISVVFGDASGISGGIAGSVENLNGLHYSRSLETEADAEGMKLMLRNGVNVEGMKQLMEVLKNEGDMPESLAFLSTHPLTSERMQKAEQFIKTNNNFEDERKDLESLFGALKHSK
jgi:Zn-dependent protease with chaperone function